MDKKLKLNILQQPTNTTCGPTALHAVYNYFDDKISLEEVVNNIVQFEEGGGTIAVHLARHALRQGYEVCLHSFNLNIFDPSWFGLSDDQILENLKERLLKKKLTPKEQQVMSEYIAYFADGGKVYFEDLTKELIIRYLRQKTPIITSLNCTWLYQDERENPITNVVDPMTGDPVGHFVVIHGIEKGRVFIADPFEQNPFGETLYYDIDFDRLINSILLGISSHDGNLLIIKR
jgi:hypothetical protein